MRKQQLALRAFGLVTALGIAAVHAGDEPANAPPAGKPKPDERRHEKGEHGKPGEKPHHGKPGSATEPSDKETDKGEGGDKERGPEEGGAREARGAARRGMRELWMDLEAGKLKKSEVKERLGELHEHRAERADGHRRELQKRFGAALAMPAAREELEHHARRLAKLNRAMVVAETEVTKDKDTLKQRIAKLIDKENARHQRAMERLQSKAPSTAAAPSADPKTPPAAGAAEKGDAP